jgi:hypothetical protein
MKFMYLMLLTSFIAIGGIAMDIQKRFDVEGASMAADIDSFDICMAMDEFAHTLYDVYKNSLACRASDVSGANK